VHTLADRSTSQPEVAETRDEARAGLPSPTCRMISRLKLEEIGACALKAFIYKPLESKRLSLYSRKKAMHLFRTEGLSTWCKKESFLK
jgi:hypothetical protein